jgi:hypothetical protein
MATREQLLAMAPKRENFETDEDFLEAKAGWQHRAGPILRMTQHLSKEKARHSSSATSAV